MRIDLYEQKSVVGARLRRYLTDNKISKLKMCKDVGISRPTLDKILAGTSNSENNYARHMEKILHYLNTTPAQLLGGMIAKNNINEISSLFKVSLEDISKRSGISVERLSEIEAGVEANLAELRDIAFCLSTSVNALKGEQVLEPIANRADICVKHDLEGHFTTEGHWGYLGVLVTGHAKHMWYPISQQTAELIDAAYDDGYYEYLVVPCLNNKAVLLNLDNVEHLMLLDDPSGDGADAIDAGAELEDVLPLPAAVCDALEDCWYDLETSDKTRISSFLMGAIQDLVDDLGWNQQDVYDMIYTTKIYFEDGSIFETTIDYLKNINIESASLLKTFASASRFGYMQMGRTTGVRFYDLDDITNYVNMETVSMIEAPLVNLEKGIAEVVNNEADSV